MSLSTSLILLVEAFGEGAVVMVIGAAVAGAAEALDAKGAGAGGPCTEVAGGGALGRGCRYDCGCG